MVRTSFFSYFENTGKERILDGQNRDLLGLLNKTEEKK